MRESDKFYVLSYKDIMRFVSSLFMDINQIGTVAVSLLTTFGLKILGAIALWIVGQKLIDFAIRLLRRVFRNQHVDATLISYLSTLR